MKEMDNLSDLISTAGKYSARDSEKIIGQYIAVSLSSMFASKNILGATVLKSNSDMGTVSDGYHIFEDNVKPVKFGKWKLWDAHIKKDIAQVLYEPNKYAKKKIIIVFCDESYESALNDIVAKIYNESKPSDSFKVLTRFNYSLDDKPLDTK